MPYKIAPAEAITRKFRPRARSNASQWTKIGNVQICQTWFGCNKVHIVNQQQQSRRNVLIFLLAVLAFVWLGANQIKHSEAQRNAASLEPGKKEISQDNTTTLPASAPAITTEEKSASNINSTSAQHQPVQVVKQSPAQSSPAATNFANPVLVPRKTPVQAVHNKSES